MMSSDKEKDIVQSLYEAHDVPVRLAELDAIYDRLMKAGFTVQAQSVMQVREGLIEYALEQNLDVLFANGIDGLKLGASDAMETKLRYKKLKRKRRQTKKKWLCCNKPVLKKSRKGSRFWMATCRYRNQRTHKVQVSNIILSRDPTKKPKHVVITQGKKRIKMRWCTGANRK